MCTSLVVWLGGGGGVRFRVDSFLTGVRGMGSGDGDIVECGGVGGRIRF